MNSKVDGNMKDDTKVMEIETTRTGRTGTYCNRWEQEVGKPER